MLRHLGVRNMGVLGEAILEPSVHFTVITGETGAGKTLLVDGLKLLLGHKPSPGLAGRQSTDCQAEGLFASGEVEFGVTRLIPASGKSRAYLDGSIVSAKVLDDQVAPMVEIVGQHDQLALLRPSHIRDIVDGSLSEAGIQAKERYETAWLELSELLRRRDVLGGDVQALRRELDMIEYQINEIDKASFTAGEEERLENDASRLRNAAEILEHFDVAENVADRLIDDAGEVLARLRKVTELDGEAAALAHSAEAAAATLAELKSDVRTYREGVNADPEQLEIVNNRLNLLGELKRKYGQSVEAIDEFAGSASRRAGELAEMLDLADVVDTRVQDAIEAVGEKSAKLTRQRKTAAEAIVSTVTDHLASLGLATAEIMFSFQQTEPGPSGADSIELQFASGKQLEPGPVATTASGGELSRLVLALRLATRDVRTETLVFDEVDTGVGGSTALEMGKKLGELSERTQVLCVTHLPQIAAFADTHYVVTRDEDVASLRVLRGEERTAEISRMMAGLKDSTASNEAAKELLELVSDR